MSVGRAHLGAIIYRGCGANVFSTSRWKIASWGCMRAFSVGLDEGGRVDDRYLDRFAWMTLYG